MGLGAYESGSKRLIDRAAASYCPVPRTALLPEQQSKFRRTRAAVRVFAAWMMILVFAGSASKKIAQSMAGMGCAWALRRRSGSRGHLFVRVWRTLEKGRVLFSTAFPANDNFMELLLDRRAETRESRR